MGDVGTGKSALAYWLLERFSQKYGLFPTVVGFPREKQSLLPSGFIVKDEPEECIGLENAIVFIDEADLQLPIEDTKARKYVTNFLSLPRHRHQIFLLAFHFPRLVLARYLPFFRGFLIKRPPYLLEFASKGKGDALQQMMEKAEERFAELPSEDVFKNTYVIAPRIRWQGMLENSLCSFWSDEVSEVWAGTEIKGGGKLIGQLIRSTDPAGAKRLSEMRALFPGGIPLDKIVDYDFRYTLKELRETCRKAGLTVSGDKKMLAARLIAFREGLSILSIKERLSEDAARLFPHGVPDGFSIERHEKNGVIIGFTLNDPTRIFTTGTTRRDRIIALLNRQHPEIPKENLENYPITYDEFRAEVGIPSSEDAE